MKNFPSIHSIIHSFDLDEIHVTLQVWDIGGQTLGGKMLENYVYGAHVSIGLILYLLYSVNFFF